MRQPLADETLLAYVDGELDPGERRLVEASLATDTAAARKVALMRASATALRGAFDEIMSEPVPERLLAVVERHALRSNGARGAGVRGWSWLRTIVAPANLVFAGGLSAAALLLGLALGPSMQPSEGEYRLAGIEVGGEAALASAVSAAMEQGVEGATATYTRSDIGVSGTITALGAVALGAVDAGPGIACRAFRDEARSGDIVSTGLGVACRGADGVWASLVVPGGATAP